MSALARLVLVAGATFFVVLAAVGDPGPVRVPVAAAVAIAWTAVALEEIVRG